MKIENIDLKHRILIKAETMSDLKYLVDNYSKEFTAFLHATRKGDDFILEEAFFPVQENSSTFTEVDAEDLFDLLDEGADMSKLCGHMHSHVNMATSPSGTDVTEIKARAASGSFNASIIMNKSGDIFGHIVDSDRGIYLQDVPVQILYPFTEEEFKTFILEESKMADSYEDLMEIVSFTYKDYYELDLDIAEEKQKEKLLDEIVKSRFNTKVYSKYPSKGANAYGKTHGNNYGNRYGNVYSDEYKKYRGTDYSYDRNKRVSDMTDKEFKEYMRDQYTFDDYREDIEYI